MRRFPYIDVLRGVAILLVMVHHLPEDIGTGAFGRVAVMGGRGVDLFFVLSGFLIGTTTLSRARSECGPYIQAKAYWLLRTLRVWPVYFGILLLFACAVPTLNPDATKMVREHSLYYLTFISNDFAQGTLELGILWSLAIEEQFYLAIGLIVLATAKRRDTLAAAFVGMAVAAIAVALRTRYGLIDLRKSGVLAEPWYIFSLYHSTLSRIDQLALGLLAAVVAPKFNAAPWARRVEGARALTWIVILATVFVLVAAPQQALFEFFLVGLVFAMSTLWVQRPAAAGLSVSSLERPFLWFMTSAGKLSYGLYMLHPITRRWVLAVFERAGIQMGTSTGYLVLAIWLPITWALAELSYRYLESPLLEWGRRKAAQMTRTSQAAAPVSGQNAGPVASV